MKKAFVIFLSSKIIGFTNSLNCLKIPFFVYKLKFRLKFNCFLLNNKKIQ